MANQICCLPAGSNEPSYPFIIMELKAQLYPDAEAGGSATRPEFGQIWPRGNSRGNA